MTDQTPDQPAHVEAKAAILLVLIGALIIAFVVYVMYARGVFEPTQRLVLVTDNSEGVSPGMDLTFEGFPIGRVSQVELAPDGKVHIIVQVPKKDAKWLRVSSVFTLVRNLMGQTSLHAYTGILSDPPLPPGAVRTVLTGDVTEEIPRLVANARALLDNLVNMTSSGSHIDTTLANLDTISGRMSGRYGLLGGALGGDAEAKKLFKTLDNVNALIDRADRRVFGKNGLMDDTQESVQQLTALLTDARATLQKVDAVLVEAQAVAANAKTATNDLGPLRDQVEASLRKVNRLVEEINHKWPFAHDTEIKLP